MSIKAVLFDLDGTLLPMDQDIFMKAYMGGLVATAAGVGYEANSFIDAVKSGIVAMVKNTGEKTNEQQFWNCMVDAFGETILETQSLFDAYYRTGFQKVKDACGFQPRAKEVVDWIKEKGFRIALATNPLFPSIATESRIRWAGLEPEDFELFTTYEESTHCKPNLDYYRDVLEQMNLSPEECIMVGNDVDEDMIASKLGMKVFLLTACMINRQNEDISIYPHGGVEELKTFIEECMD